MQIYKTILFITRKASLFFKKTQLLSIFAAFVAISTIYILFI